jgi:hypothetical protein
MLEEHPREGSESRGGSTKKDSMNSLEPSSSIYPQAMRTTSGTSKKPVLFILT